MSLQIMTRPDGIAVLEWTELVALDASNAAELRTQVGEVLAISSQLIFDMARVDFVDSSIIGALVGFLRRAQTGGGDVKLVGLTPNVETIFEVTRLQRVFSIHATVPAAVEEFGTTVS